MRIKNLVRDSDFDTVEEFNFDVLYERYLATCRRLKGQPKPVVVHEKWCTSQISFMSDTDCNCQAKTVPIVTPQF